MHRHTYKSHHQGNGYPSSGYGSYQQPGYGCLAPYPPTSFSSMSPYQVNPPSPMFDCSNHPSTGLVCGRIWDAKPLSQRSNHCFPRQQLEARTQVFYFSTFTQLGLGRDNSFQFLETFAKLLTDGQSESCS